MTSSLSDILTATKNIVTALNSSTQAYLSVNGQRNAAKISAATVVYGKPGRLAVVSVTSAGTTVGTIYDSSSISVTTAPLYTIPNTVGVYPVNLPTSYGVLVVPGTGQVVTISYS